MKMLENREVLPPCQDDWVGAKEKVTLESGIELAYVEWGDVNAPTVILIHGYTDNSRAYSLIAPHLKGRRFIAVDLRGHGDSTQVRRDINFLSFASDLCEFMDRLGIEKADFVGHSMGSMTAAIFAALYARRISKVVLIATALQPGPAVSDWLLKTIENQTYPLDVTGKFLEDWTWNPHPVDQAFMNYLKKEASRVAYETWHECLVAFRVTNWSMLAQDIKAPVFVMWGDKDQFFNAADQEEVRKVLPDAKYRTYVDYGHSVTWEIPELAAKDIMEFLNSGE